MDISKCFRGSLRLGDNESRLYVYSANLLTDVSCVHLISQAEEDACNKIRGDLENIILDKSYLQNVLKL